MADDGEPPVAAETPPEASSNPPHPPHHDAEQRSAEAETQRAERDGDARGYDDLNQAFSQQVHNHFHAGVQASDATFGFGTPRTPGLAPGYVRPEEVARTLRHYLCPEACFEEALAKVTDEHLVVLTGQEDIGRRAGAFALLRRLTGPDTGFRSLSPANSLADLAASNALKARQAFVILDYVGETNAEAVQFYDMGRLAEELRRKHSYLVITATENNVRRLAFSGHCVPWRAPDPLELFRRITGDPPAAAAPEELVKRVGEQRRPSDVVAAAASFADGGAPAAMKVLSGSDEDAVRDWFGRQPLLEDLLPLVALAFLEGVPERTFEARLALLDRFVRDWELTGENGPGDRDTTATPGPGPTTLRQSRVLWGERAVGLVRVERHAAPGESTERSERRMIFTSLHIRDLIIRELYDRYGYDLWYPLRQWLRDLSQDQDLDVRSEVARGAALLARHALTEVDVTLLQEWADGLAAQRVTAALTLQYMAESDRLAPAALNVALSWAENRGPARAITMAMALAGTLGSLYRLEVLNWLWRLTERGERMAAAARRSLVLLLQTAEQDPDRALFTVRYMRTRIANSRRGSRDEFRAVATAAQMVAADRLAGQPGTLAGVLIQKNPEIARQMGRLWARLLLSRGRRTALDALCRTLVAVRDEPSASEAVRLLGEAMRAEMTPAKWQTLRSQLMGALRHPDLAMPGTRRLAQVLLGTLQT